MRATIECGRIWITFCLAFAISLTQVSMLLLLARGSSLRERWLGLIKWDALWYASVVKLGYVSDLPPTPERPDLSNVGHFPGFPLFALFLHSLGFSAEASLIVVSQTACMLFWILFFVLAGRWNVSRVGALAAAGLFGCYFGSYILAAPYSEGVFLAALLSLVLATGELAEGSRFAWLLAVLSGILLGATRPIGFLGGAYPILLGLLLLRQGRILFREWLWRYATLGLAPSFGLFAFLAYCARTWGQWDLYFRAMRATWHLKPDLLFPFHASNYVPWIPLYRVMGFYGATWSHIAAALFFWLCAAAAGLEWRARGTATDQGLERRVGLYGTALLMFTAALVSAGPDEFTGMSRYCVPPLALLALALMDLIGRGPRIARGWIGVPVLFAVVSLSAQLVLATMYARGEWME